MRMDTALLEQAPEQFLLGWRMGMGDGMSIATLVRLDSFDDAMNPVALSESVLHLLKDEDTTALSATVAVCRSIKRLALAGGTEEMSSIKTEIHLGRDH